MSKYLILALAILLTTALWVANEQQERRQENTDAQARVFVTLMALGVEGVEIENDGSLVFPDTEHGNRASKVYARLMEELRD